MTLGHLKSATQEKFSSKELLSRKSIASKMQIISKLKKKNLVTHSNLQSSANISFSEVNEICKKFSAHIENNFEKITKVLLNYESFEVVKDETSRTLDLLTHLDENSQFFQRRVGPVTCFLPRNQPLYSLVCFVAIPSLMATEVHFRPPQAMKFFYEDLLNALNFRSFFQNVYTSNLERLDFLRDRSAILINKKTGQTQPITNVVIFTGAKENADMLRKVFDKRTLFITNGSGHNPIVVTEFANISKAVNSAVSVQLYNQGQDCASPDAVLVHKKVYKKFIAALKKELRKIKIGCYSNKKNRIGPISEIKDLKRIQSIFVENAKWLEPDFPGEISTKDKLIKPTIISKPLSEGGNYSELFAPVFFVQKYSSDADLSEYFEDPNYATNAMYISLFGKSSYIEKLVLRKIGGRFLHDSASIIRNSDPHAVGFERGTQQYGGYGPGASSISYLNKTVAKPILVQRDIYEYLVKSNSVVPENNNLQPSTCEVIYKDVESFYASKSLCKTHENKILKGLIYYENIETTGSSPLQVLREDRIHQVLTSVNKDYVSKMSLESILSVRELKSALGNNLTIDEIKTLIYSLPIKPWLNNDEVKIYQKGFFKDLYHLLLGKDSGPYLPKFLYYADRSHIQLLMSI